MSDLPPNVIVSRLLLTDILQQLKKQRDFLKWMTRKYADENPLQSEAFATGARLFDELREDLKAGLFDAPAEKELFTPGDLPSSSILAPLPAEATSALVAGEEMIEKDRVDRQDMRELQKSVDLEGD